MIEPYFQNHKVAIYHGDARDVLCALSGVTAVVTDPPYQLGFMGKAWDRCGISFEPEFWQLVSESALPGAHLLAFGGTRTFHRIACAVEDGGWDIRDTLLWLYGSGFPKSLNIGNQLPEWKGYGSALKPAFEPIILARKLLSGTVAQNVTVHGCGALNIDGCRVPSSETLGRINKNCNVLGDNTATIGCGPSRAIREGEKGRWPANVIHDGSAEVVSGFPETCPSDSHLRHNNGKDLGKFGKYNPAISTGVNDSGSAARFFYCAKASGDERDDNTHATVKPLALMEYLCRLIKQPERNLVLDPFAGSGTTLLACELLGIKCVGIELDEAHCEIIAKRFSKPAEPYLI